VTVRVQSGDVERIVRDVMTTNGCNMTVIRTEGTAEGWRVTLRETAARVIALDLPSGPPASIRAAVQQWIDTQA